MLHKRLQTRDSSHRDKETGHDEAKNAASWPQPSRYGNRRCGRTAGVGCDQARGPDRAFASGGSVNGGAAIADGSVYWGSGYCGTLCPGGATPVLNNNKVYALGLK